MYTDGSSNSFKSRAGLILPSPKENVAEYALHFEFLATNNGANLKALIIILKLVKEVEV